jgi:hypothetical protein
MRQDDTMCRLYYTALCLIAMVPVVVGHLTVNNTNLLSAFQTVFNFKDSLSTFSTPVLESAYHELEKMGLSRNFSNLCSLNDFTVSHVLMKAAYAEYIIGLQDPNDWSIIVADGETGQLIRKKSFSSTRFAIIESLLLITIIALGRQLWLK